MLSSHFQEALDGINVFWGVAHEATFLMQEARSELSQNEASPVQCPLRNQRENRYVNINPQNTETLEAELRQRWRTPDKRSKTLVEGGPALCGRFYH